MMKYFKYDLEVELYNYNNKLYSNFKNNLFNFSEYCPNSNINCQLRISFRKINSKKII